MHLEEVCDDGPADREVRFRYPPTGKLDENGRGKVHADFVVDLDPKLGLVRVDTAQDFGRVLDSQSLLDQIEGGVPQGVGLAVMGEPVGEGGVIRNGNFTDYLLPTFLDTPEVEAQFVEEPDHWGPFEAKGVEEPQTISSIPAVVAAIRAAMDKVLNRIPVRSEDNAFE